MLKHHKICTLSLHSIPREYLDSLEESLNRRHIFVIPHTAKMAGGSFFSKKKLAKEKWEKNAEKCLIRFWYHVDLHVSLLGWNSGIAGGIGRPLGLGHRGRGAKNRIFYVWHEHSWHGAVKKQPCHWEERTLLERKRERENGLIEFGGPSIDVG